MNVREYEVKTQVPPAVFAAFVKMIEGCPIDISEDTIVFFRGLSQEFGFKLLEEECVAFESLHRHYSEDSTQPEISMLYERICELEESQLRQSHTIAVLERNMFNVLQSRDAQQKRLSNQERLFEIEQMYQYGRTVSLFMVKIYHKHSD
jgi:hypothetical protein